MSIAVKHGHQSTYICMMDSSMYHTQHTLHSLGSENDTKLNSRGRAASTLRQVQYNMSSAHTPHTSRTQILFLCETPATPEKRGGTAKPRTTVPQALLNHLGAVSLSVFSPGCSCLAAQGEGAFCRVPARTHPPARTHRSINTCLPLPEEALQLVKLSIKRGAAVRLRPVKNVFMPAHDSA